MVRKKLHLSSPQTAGDNVFLPGFRPTRGGGKGGCAFRGPIFEGRESAQWSEKKKKTSGGLERLTFSDCTGAQLQSESSVKLRAKRSLTCTDMLAVLGATRKPFAGKSLGWHKSWQVEKGFCLVYSGT